MSNKTIEKNSKSLKLPKSVGRKRDKYIVVVYEKKTNIKHHVGTFDTIEEAIIARDKYIVENYDLLDGYTPRGISFNKARKKYIAYLCFGKVKIHLGYFKNLNDAIQYRNKYIDSLK